MNTVHLFAGAHPDEAAAAPGVGSAEAGKWDNRILVRKQSLSPDSLKVTTFTSVPDVGEGVRQDRLDRRLMPYKGTNLDAVALDPVPRSE